MVITISVKTRICKKCKRELSETKENFVLGSNKSRKTWWLPTCRDCMYPKGRYRICPRCGERKHITQYYRSSKNKWCKECMKSYQKERRKLKSERENIKEGNSDLKAIGLYKELSEKVCVLMRTNRIGKYNNNVRNVILGLMKICHEHLGNELKNNKEVIEVDWE